ncbi:MAG: sugar phosphate isomerase/epimerase [Anaerolineae bacterium]|nr:sugar phosphate isomerase/epimerase [Anaerolineae bacterium]
MLSSMAGKDFAHALDQHQAWNLKVLDLKDGIFGKSVTDLTDGEARHAADLINRRGLSVYCLSTMLFAGVLESGPEIFQREHLDRLDRVIAISAILRPALVRLLSPETEKRAEFGNSIRYIAREHPWLLRMYAEAIHRLKRAGFPVTIENEVGNNVFSTPEEVVDLFAALGYRDEVGFTWDVQNLWQMGPYPTMEVYQRLKGVIRYYHLKGGQHGPDSLALQWRTSLEDASWPVIEITRQVVADGVSPVICLNPPHGKPKEGYDYSDLVKRDLDFVRRVIPGVA